jgi:hypothetical protein
LMYQRYRFQCDNRKLITLILPIWFHIVIVSIHPIVKSLSNWIFQIFEV